jgi:2-dehydropantoate 2-reductase
MGCVYGANLARIGQHVAFLDVWEEHVAHINKHGLFVTGLTGDFHVRVNAYTNVDELPKADIALICVNAYSTSDAARKRSHSAKGERHMRHASERCRQC